MIGTRLLRPSARFVKRECLAAARNVAGVVDLGRMRLSQAHGSNLSISFCTTVKDRFEHLTTTFIRNLEDNAQYPNCEFVLLNYNCPDSRTEKWVSRRLTPYLAAGRVAYYFFGDAETYHMAHSRNLAFRLATGSVVCNVDADNFLGKGFANYVAVAMSRRDVFLRGPGGEGGVAGRIGVRRADWEAVSGYDERFECWGGDDTDFAQRLEMLGKRRRMILLRKFCGCISHSDELRTRHFHKDKADSARDHKLIIAENASRKVIRPNRNSFGHGRVLKNFSEWIEV